jgi:hypothetical protein
MRRPRAPHLPHFTLDWNHGSSTLSGYFDTSMIAWWRQASWRQNAIRWRIRFSFPFSY